MASASTGHAARSRQTTPWCASEWGAAISAVTGGETGLSEVADIGNDRVDQALAAVELPKHVHLTRSAGTLRDG
ncbi:hypothetical protein [Mesorhizobium amorphae]|uniref:Putative DNA binding protein n=1 Tax=Mesorhizobium amorphae CCNWGS0123 TaxID=1082933 RepID=G6YLV5_9HYPH|nr:hypothetical protein [Mesorhizobium amorphae]ANT52877.1 hypothetical protein A6B35_24830 [Mesorhizobium amorphae CCNWGS0123]EHH02456.1 putative DNA binding protein [Mesorhizobium amorphae CCNWGS0123]GLR45470.1 hypothetical protein GCM10007880_59880 [Mesorhizobium amorphae]